MIEETRTYSRFLGCGAGSGQRPYLRGHPLDHEWEQRKLLPLPALGPAPHCVVHRYQSLSNQTGPTTSRSLWPRGERPSLYLLCHGKCTRKGEPGARRTRASGLLAFTRFTDNRGHLRSSQKALIRFCRFNSDRVTSEYAAGWNRRRWSTAVKLSELIPALAEPVTLASNLKRLRS
jgi:hypothetical protein